jgi:hypothetical protein
MQGDDPDGQGPDSPGTEQQGRHLGAVALADAARVASAVATNPPGKVTLPNSIRTVGFARTAWIKAGPGGRPGAALQVGNDTARGLEPRRVSEPPGDRPGDARSQMI